MRQKVANYPGVTVEHHSGRMKSIGRSDLTLIDLPGIYSLATYSEDARVAVDVLTGKMPGVPQPDCVLLVLDATHMNRQLMLAAPVFSIGLPTLVLLNMSDQMEARGGKLDTLALAKRARASGRADQRGAGQRAGRHSRVSGSAPAAAPDDGCGRCSCRCCRRAASLPQLGHAGHLAHRVISPPQLRCGRGVWTRVLLHRVAGPLIFLAVVFAVFQVVFTLGQPLSRRAGQCC